MPSTEEHCRKCIIELGEPFREVNEWLDEFCGKPPYGTRHRFLRHHRDGVELVRQRWGDKAARAAEIHIRQDLAGEGWPDDWPIPTQEDYRKHDLW